MFGFVPIYIFFNKFYGGSIHILSILSIHIHRAATCSFISFDKFAVFFYLKHVVIKLGISELQKINLKTLWLFSTMSDKHLEDVRKVFTELGKVI